MAIKVGDKIPSATLTAMGSDGPGPVTTEDLFSGKKVAVFAVVIAAGLIAVAGTPPEAIGRSLTPFFEGGAAYSATYSGGLVLAALLDLAIARGEMAVLSDTVERLAGHPPISLRAFLASP